MGVKPLVSGSFLVALGVIIPTIFHMTGVGGTIFLPMHIPVLFAGVILGPGLAALVGMLWSDIKPLIDRHAPPKSRSHAADNGSGIGGLRLVMGYFFDRYSLNIWISLLGAMILGRLAAGLTVAVIAPLFNLPLKPLPFIQGALVTGLPGIILQLLIVPPVTQRFFTSYREKETSKFP